MTKRIVAKAFLPLTDNGAERPKKISQHLVASCDEFFQCHVQNFCPSDVLKVAQYLITIPKNYNYSQWQVETSWGSEDQRDSSWCRRLKDLDLVVRDIVGSGKKPCD